MANGKIRFGKQSGGVLEFKRGWENQEVVYGLIQGIALWYVIIKNILI